MLYYVSAHQGHVILCQCPSGPGYIMSVPTRARLHVSARQGQVRLCYIMSVPIRAMLYYVSTHQGQVTCQCPTGPGYIMSVPIRARLHVSARQGQVIGQCPSGPGYRSVPSRARYQCPAGPTKWLVWFYLRVTASIAVLNAPTPVDQYRAPYPTRMRMLAGPLVKP